MRFISRIPTLRWAADRPGYQWHHFADVSNLSDAASPTGRNWNPWPVHPGAEKVPPLPTAWQCRQSFYPMFSFLSISNTSPAGDNPAAIRSQSTIIFTSSANFILGFQRNSFAALDGAPASRSTSEGRKYRESILMTVSPVFILNEFAISDRISRTIARSSIPEPSHPISIPAYEKASVHPGAEVSCQKFPMMMPDRIVL